MSFISSAIPPANTVSDLKVYLCPEFLWDFQLYLFIAYNVKNENVFLDGLR